MVYAKLGHCIVFKAQDTVVLDVPVSDINAPSPLADYCAPNKATSALL